MSAPTTSSAGVLDRIKCRKWIFHQLFFFLIHEYGCNRVSASPSYCPAVVPAMTESTHNREPKQALPFPGCFCQVLQLVNIVLTKDVLNFIIHTKTSLHLLWFYFTSLFIPWKAFTRNKYEIIFVGNKRRKSLHTYRS